MSQIDWSKAPEGATHYGPAVERQWLACWHKKVDEQWLGWLADGDTRWGPAGNTVERIKQLISRPQELTGEGLPPVGAECEFSDWEKEDWKRGVVRYMSAVTAVIEIGDNHEQIAHPTTLRYRPIRTPKQITAEDRQRVIKQIIADFKYTAGPCTYMITDDQAARLYDAGYRKFEIVEN